MLGGGANNGQARKDADARPKDDGDVAEGTLGRGVGAVPEKVGDRGREAREDGRGEDGVDVAVDVEMPPERALVVKRHRGGLPGTCLSVWCFSPEFWNQGSWERRREEEGKKVESGRVVMDRHRHRIVLVVVLCSGMIALLW